jgi:hypothetical protein
MPQMRSLCSQVLGRQGPRSAEYPVVLSNRTIARTVRRTQPFTQNPHQRRPTSRIVSFSITRSIRGTQIPIARDEPPSSPFPAVSSLGGFPTPAAHARATPPSAAGIRKPSQKRTFNCVAWRQSSATDLTPRCSRSRMPCPETDWVGKSRRGPGPSPSTGRTRNSCSCR